MQHIIDALQRSKDESTKKVVENDNISSQHEPDTEKIQYTKSRIIPLDNRVLKKNRIIAGIGPGSINDSYRILRTQILQRMQDNNWNVLAITSPKTGEGKTVTAINLAITMAMEINHTVLLVDLDLRNPCVHKYFGYQPDKGISDYLNKSAQLDEILINPSIDRLVVLPGREAIFNSSEILSSPLLVRMVGELKTRYPQRLVLFDLPPLLDVDDALAFSPYVDAVLLVLEEGKTTEDELKQTMDILKPFNVIGSVLNKTYTIKKKNYTGNNSANNRRVLN